LTAESYLCKKIDYIKVEIDRFIPLSRHPIIPDLDFLDTVSDKRIDSEIEVTIHTLAPPHLKCIGLVPVRSSHLPFEMYQVGFLRLNLSCINISVPIELTSRN